jgi:phage tail sheath protein FI
MPTYTNPGVYVSESTLATNAKRSNLAQAAGCFFGTAPRGPLDATLIDSWSAYKNYYGDISASHELGFSVYHYFANGGREAYIVRVASGASSTSAATATVPYFATAGASATSALFTANAANVGAWGNGLTVKTEAISAANTYPAVGTATQQYQYNLIVTLDGIEVERWNSVCSDPTDNRFVKTVVNTYSKYITIPTTSWPSAVVGAAPYTTAVTLASGNDGTAIATDDYTNAINTKLLTVEGSLILNAPGVTAAAGTAIDVSAIVALNNVATSRGNSFVIVDPADLPVKADIATLVSTYPQSSYLSVYYPKLKMVDPTKTGPAAIRDTFPGGAVMGAYIRTDSTRSVAKAPAGYDVDVRNAIGLTNVLSPANTGDLYESYGVNSFKAIPGGGIIIHGARTLDKSTPGKYIPIRRSLNFLKQSLADSTGFAVFEPNDERLWTRLTMTVSSILSEFWRSGGLKGTNASQAFYIICDSTNNTPTSIQNGEVNIQVGVALQYPAEFIVINLSQWTGGSNTVSTL